VRAGKWKYRYAAGNAHATYEMVDLEVGEFLHDLEQDPSETQNLASDYPGILEQLKEYHRRWLLRMDTTHPTAD
jgi:hypothetical protein